MRRLLLVVACGNQPFCMIWFAPGIFEGRIVAAQNLRIKIAGFLRIDDIDGIMIEAGLFAQALDVWSCGRRIGNPGRSGRIAGLRNGFAEILNGQPVGIRDKGKAAKSLAVGEDWEGLGLPASSAYSDLPACPAAR